MTEFECDVAIVGGGIAGLWAMHELRARGFSPVLLERHTLGGAQTLAAQGILHGGMKYVLDGKVDDIALRLREMPPRWLDSMAGKGEVDLTGTQILSECQYLWSDGSLLSKLSGAMGAKMLQGDVNALPKEQWPTGFHELGYKGSVRALQETIIDVRSALTALVKPLEGCVFQADEISPNVTGEILTSLDLRSADGTSCRLKPRFLVNTAGTGNELFATALPFPQPATQRRPLRQILVRGVPHKIYGHCIIADPKPRVTITSHTLTDGTPVWYLGGNVAEKACKMSLEESLKFAASELSAIFPKHSWSQYAYAAWDIDRAEPHQSVRFMPSEPTVNVLGNSALAWPTKLVFAPGLATKIAQEAAERSTPMPAPHLPLPAAVIGQYPWDQAHWQNI
jgi:glycerol-3-phosphate dehydrogenase